ncbi:hypothetical protein PR202_gb24920 [Eleusine coracana subsp. coracana]|uniref:Protein kinase domain-containing protein n=1 Tax=Eleusine coracana subsp. coracana TaxID=191504 RepID=A0AAV5FJZ2_ELECO|nr:hypothetical protein PR202_gb24920 [Eleusine coracana subsp. coracana]
MDFFTEYGEGSRYKIEEVIGKGSYGVVCSALDTHTGEKVAIKKINDIFEHVSDATRILREIKLLRLLRHPDIVEIKHILLPPSRREFRDIYVVFELMESDLHQVIKANDDLTPEHYQFFLYQLLRGLKYIHTANVFHRDLKPKNILANADCKLKICDFGLARVAFHDTPTAIFWTDYVATRWYRAPELCGSFFSKYTPAIDIWSIGCIFAELLTGKPLFPGKNVVHQLDIITDLLGTPSPEAISRALADSYFKNIANVDREPSAQPVTKLEFEFERRRVTKEDIRELIYREILEYHPKMLREFLEGTESSGFMYPSAVDQFKKQFAYLEEHYAKGSTGTPPERQHNSLPRPSVIYSDHRPQSTAGITEDLSKCLIRENAHKTQQHSAAVGASAVARPGKVVGSVLQYNSSPASAAEQYEQRRVARHPAIGPNNIPSGNSYPRRNQTCKSETELYGNQLRSIFLSSMPQTHNVALFRELKNRTGRFWWQRHVLLRSEVQFPCSPFVSDVLALYGLEIQQVLPNTIARLAYFEWAFRMEGSEPHAGAFAATHLASQQEHPCPGDPTLLSNYLTITLRPCRERDVPTKGSRQHWGKQIASGWFYYDVGPDSNFRSRNVEIIYTPKPEVPEDSLLSSRIRLLSHMAKRVSIRDLVEEFCAADIDPLRADWHVQFITQDPVSGALQFNRERLPKINFAEIEQRAIHYLGPLIQKEWELLGEKGCRGRTNRIVQLYNAEAVLPPPPPPPREPHRAEARQTGGNAAKGPDDEEEEEETEEEGEEEAAPAAPQRQVKVVFNAPCNPEG